ncbi:MAG: hypothetical protein IJ220_03130 [Clostridia bacterium]|nr:hypothetical protein [Clostridia bacterium]
MHKEKLYPPIAMVKDFCSDTPEIFSIYDAALEKHLSEVTEYDIAKVITKTIKRFADEHEAKDYIFNLMVLDEWRKSKQVYTFSPQLYQLICEMDSDIVIENTIFEYLPNRTFYIDLPENGAKIEGVFVKYFHDDINNVIVLIALYENCFHATIAFGLDESDDLTFERFLKTISNNDLSEETKSLFCFAFNASLYLCSRNCDVKENRLQKDIYRPSRNIRDKFSEVRKWDVGYRISREKVNDTDLPHHVLPNENGRNRPRQHIRRAHWHTYYVGKGRSRRELRFIAPIIVNNIGDEMPVVVHKK